ncbi:polysaccharide biosynthesis/export family protein [Glaciecola sp. 1036]|uniref:polysaccharide biosynthesis/export family protein n=1 Tax=Alteromonadaceae TaxID=72275 RepID=UPI003D07B921
MKLLRTAFYAGFILISLSGCASTDYDDVERPDIPTREIANPYVYKLGVGDKFSVKFFYNPELNEEIMIRPDGKASLQLAGDIEMAGLTVEELRLKLTDQFTSFLKNPEVSVIVREIESQQIFVGGEVVNPGMYKATGGLSPLQAIFLAGGAEATAELSTIVILRDNGEPFLDYYIIDMENNLGQPNQFQYFQLQANDIVFVPQSRIASINQFVDQYIQKMLPILGNLNFSVFYDINGDRTNL